MRTTIALGIYYNESVAGVYQGVYTDTDRNEVLVSAPVRVDFGEDTDPQNVIKMKHTYFSCRE